MKTALMGPAKRELWKLVLSAHAQRVALLGQSAQVLASKARLVACGCLVIRTVGGSPLLGYSRWRECSKRIVKEVGVLSNGAAGVRRNVKEVEVLFNGVGGGKRM